MSGEEGTKATEAEGAEQKQHKWELQDQMQQPVIQQQLKEQQRQQE